MIWENKECLHLVLKKKWFIAIANGTKKIEYRDNTPFWERRLNNKNHEYILFQYAYNKNPTHMVVEFIKKELNDRWELHLGDIIHIDNRHINELK